MRREIEITNNDDYIDVRDVIARVEELREEFEREEITEDNGAEAQRDENDKVKEDIATCGTCGKSWNDALISSRTPAPSGRCPYEHIHEELAELTKLESLLDDLRGNGGDEQWEGDWYPVTLIRDSYFETAMDELLEDIGDMPKNIPPYLKVTVDYDALQMDYTSTEFEGVTYWYR